MTLFSLVTGALLLGVSLIYIWALVRPPHSRFGRWLFGLREGERHRLWSSWGLAGLPLVQGLNAVLSALEEARRIESNSLDVAQISLLCLGLAWFLVMLLLDRRRPNH